MTNAQRIIAVKHAIERHNLQKGIGRIPLIHEAVYPTILNSGYVDAPSCHANFNCTPGNFVIVFLISRILNGSPIITADGWKVWGGYGPIRRSAEWLQRIWILTKISTGAEYIYFNTVGAGCDYIIFYEFNASEINLNSPFIIGSAPTLVYTNQYAYLSKCVDKLVIWAGHSCYFQYNQQPIWRTTSGLPLIGGASIIPLPNYMMGTLADTTRLSDQPIGNGYGVANMIYTHDTGNICSIVPIAINHS